MLVQGQDGAYHLQHDAGCGRLADVVSGFARIVETVGGDTLTGGHSHVNRSNGIFLGASRRACIARGGNTDVCPQLFAGTHSHLTGCFGRHLGMSLDGGGRYAQLVDLYLVGIGDKSTQIHRRSTRNPREISRVLFAYSYFLQKRRSGRPVGRLTI